ncbi:MAG: hypothetical protein FJ038_07215 [Chloroflexi bacterium]|nr:hypothetical protein [Chloroflexota bacterium]
MGVPFESEGQRRAWERLRAPLEELYPGQVRERIHAIGYVMTVDGTIVTTTLVPRGDDDATVANRVYLAGKVPVTVEMLRLLTRWTERRRFGHYGVDAEDNVFVEEQFVASTLTREVLGASLESVLASNRNHRQEFRDQFGGGDL